MLALMFASCRAVKQPVTRDRYVRSRPASVPQSGQSVSRQVCPDRVVTTGPPAQPTASTGEWSGATQTTTVAA